MRITGKVKFTGTDGVTGKFTVRAIEPGPPAREEDVEIETTNTEIMAEARSARASGETVVVDYTPGLPKVATSIVTRAK